MDNISRVGRCASIPHPLAIPLTSFDEIDSIDLAIDGVDEIAPGLELIKGGGGALLHEKIVATSSKRLVIVAGELKRVDHLDRFPLPVEAIRFAAVPVRKLSQNMGANPELRCAPDGRPFLTDEGNFVFDCSFGRIEDPAGVAQAIKSMTGVVEHGLFVGLASMAIIAGPSGTQILTA